MRWGHGVGLADVPLAVGLRAVTWPGIVPVSTALSRSFTVSSSLNFVNDHGAGIVLPSKTSCAVLHAIRGGGHLKALARLRCFAGYFRVHAGVVERAPQELSR
jgi:hypothetical protein